jgi:L-ascorbate metabolism protein UlaG (beta-lactamase superfamily)
MLYFFALIILIVLCLQVIGIFISAPRYHGPVSDHFNGKQFVNYGNVKAKGLFNVLRWMATRHRGKWFKKQNSPAPKPSSSVIEKIKVTFINHSSFLIQTDGINILLDPVFSVRVSPFQWMGPKRMKEPGIQYSDLPPIHFVVLSHNHYDHLDIPTVRRLENDHHPKFITPLGVKAYLVKENCKTVTDMDWWQKENLTTSIEIESVPAQHFSGRGSIDRDATLWCGYVLRTSHGSIYFAGDTGYNEESFKLIGSRCAPIDLSIIPIGAYKPTWFMSPIHCNPEEAVKIHLALNSKKSVASHFGTFPLADDSQDDPVNDLWLALEQKGLSHDEFLALKEGESLSVSF